MDVSKYILLEWTQSPPKQGNCLADCPIRVAPISFTAKIQNRSGLKDPKMERRRKVVMPRNKQKRKLGNEYLQHSIKSDHQTNRAEATLVKDFSAIQLKKFDLEFSVDPLFKKTSADFDEGGAKGLLLNHLSLDKEGRIVFDAGDTVLEENEQEAAELSQDGELELDLGDLQGN
jgi:hypothetical protein